MTLLEDALQREMPVLAICHGMQLLNVQQGGTLDQHLADRHDLLDHDRDRPRAEPAHGLRIKPGSLLANALEGERAQVNSHHHQGLGVVPPTLEELAWAEDGVLEAVGLRDHPFALGVQWHPEAMAPVDPRQLELFRAFVAATDDYARRSSVRTA
jgi:putative glutamine amidotransferase